MKQYKLIGNTSSGYCFNPLIFDTRFQAQVYGREMKRDGYWFDYRIFEINDDKSN